MQASYNTDVVMFRTIVKFIGYGFIFLMFGCTAVGDLELQEIAKQTTSAGTHRLDVAGGCEDKNWLPYLTCRADVFACKGPKRVPWNIPESRQVSQAVINFEYALMASNAYRDSEETIYFEIPGWKLKERWKSLESGLSLEVYHKQEGSNLEHISVAYEGTNFTSLNDWKFNFSLLNPTQFEQALEHAQKLRKAHPSALITFTGHSLGGGLALNMSMLITNSEGIAFNSSPRAFFGNPNQKNGNRRVHLYETGEILNVLSRWYLFLRLSEGQMLPVKYNFLDYTNFSQSVSEHGMYNLARGLLLAAIYGGSEKAKRVFVSNIPRQKALEIDALYCGTIYENYAQDGDLSSKL